MFTTTLLQCLCALSTAYCTTMLINVRSLLLTNKTKWNVYMCKYYCNPNNNVIYFFFTSFHKNCNFLLSLKILYFLFQYFNVCPFGAIYVNMCMVYCWPTNSHLTSYLCKCYIRNYYPFSIFSIPKNPSINYQNKWIFTSQKIIIDNAAGWMALCHPPSYPFCSCTPILCVYTKFILQIFSNPIISLLFSFISISFINLQYIYSIALLRNRRK